MVPPKSRSNSAIVDWSTAGSDGRNCGLYWADSYPPSPSGSGLADGFSSFEAFEGERSTTFGGCAATIGCETDQAGGTAALVAVELSSSSVERVGGSMFLMYL